LNLGAGSPWPPTFATPPKREKSAIRPNTLEPASPQCPAEGRPITRKERVEAYRAEIQKLTGIRITKTDIWKAAGYKARTEFERWERDDALATTAADLNISRVLNDVGIMKRYLEKQGKIGCV